MPETLRDRPGQRLRRLQARGRPHDHRRVPRARARRGLAALLQRRGRERRARRGPRARDPPDPARAAGRRRQARARLGVRHRLPDRPTAPPCATTSTSRTSARPTSSASSGPPNPGEHRIYNLGNGTGFSVRQVIEAARAVTGREIPVTEEGRRPGDPAALVASSQKIRDELGWVPTQARDRDDDRRRLGLVPGAPAGLRRLTAFLAYARKMISRMTAMTSAAMAMVRVDMVPPPVAGRVDAPYPLDTCVQGLRTSSAPPMADVTRACARLPHAPSLPHPTESPGPSPGSLVLAVLLPIGLRPLAGRVRGRHDATPNSVFSSAASFNTVAVTLTNPGTPLRGTVILNAVATSDRGMGNVVFQTSPAGANTWTTVCTDNAHALQLQLGHDGRHRRPARHPRGRHRHAPATRRPDTVTNRRVDNTGADRDHDRSRLAAHRHRLGHRRRL